MLDPARGVAGEEELRRLREASEWQGKVYAAEHALFGAEHGTPGIVGSHDEYRWLTMIDRDITSLLDICPEIVLGKYLAVTRIDGGPLRLTEQEKAQGWWTTEAGRVFQGTSWSPPEYQDDWRIAYSPRINSIHGLPNETHDECCAGYDEWYVFEHQVPVEDIEAFVNWVGFRCTIQGFNGALIDSGVRSQRSSQNHTLQMARYSRSLHAIPACSLA